MKTRYLFLLLGCLIVTACERGTDAKSPFINDNTTTVMSGETKPVLLLEFREQEVGIKPYRSRMLISDDAIRIDEGKQSDGFVLFDRKQQRIYSVVHSTRQVVVIDPGAGNGIGEVEPPASLILTHARVEDQGRDYPKVMGKVPVYYQFSANGSVCYHVVAVTDMLPAATRAMTEYRKTLAAHQLSTLAHTPEAMQTPCFLANHVYASDDYLAQGFPIEQWDEANYRRSLIRFKEDELVDAALFDLPQGYQEFVLGSQPSIPL